MKSEFRSVSLMLAIALVCLQATLMAQEKGFSHVRVVRLSFVNGTVLVKRPGSTVWAKASVNTPIEEGFSLSTAENGFAEVQFENGSTARLGRLSQIDFSELALAQDGSKINHLVFDRGYATFDLSPTKHEHDVYQVKAGETTLTPDGKAEFRTDLKNNRLRVEVFDGSVEAAGPDKEAKLDKNKVLDVRSSTEEAFNITNGIKKDDWDHWVHARDTQAELAYNDSPVAQNSSMYGWSDLDEYGEWGYFPGFGYGWSPYAAAGWSPFSMGQWSYYPSFGYTWISSEPWGWLPFHYGYWNYSPMYGYMWSPGSMNEFYPGVVSWFQGPGYYGWAPMGANGAAACSPTVQGCVTAVRPATLAGGGAINGTSRVPVNPVVLNRIPGPSVRPGVQAMLSGTPYRPGVINPALARTMSPVRVPGLVAARGVAPRSIAPHVQASAAHGMAMTRAAPRTNIAANSPLAPRIVLMGQSVSQGARMEAQANAHESFLARAFGGGVQQPAMVHMGNTIGGRFAVRPIAGGAPFSRPIGISPSFARQAPVFLPHRAAMGGAAPRFQLQGGAIRMQGGGMMRSAGPESSGGYRGPAMGAPSGGFSGPSMSAPHSAPMAGGGHAVSAPAAARR